MFNFGQSLKKEYLYLNIHQGQDPGGDQEDLQHQERFHAQRGGAGPQGERMVRGEVI